MPYIRSILLLLNFKDLSVLNKSSQNVGCDTWNLKSQVCLPNISTAPYVNYVSIFKITLQKETGPVLY